MKRTFLGIAIFVVSISVSAQKAPAPKNVPKNDPRKPLVLEDINAAKEAKDHIALRLLIKRLGQMRLSPAEWIRIRRILHDQPEVGFDLMAKWDSVAPRNLPVTKREKIISDWIAKADQDMESGRFEQSFRLFQQVAKHLKKAIEAGSLENRFLYHSILHSMGRALFGARRFGDAITVYNWIPSEYPKFRQVLFEKMWAGFRANRSDVANGAIASLHSTFFSDFLEPEAYLVQIYLYKKLCRQDDMKQALQLMKKFKRRLQEGSVTLQDWAKAEIETYMLLRLAEREASESTYKTVSAADLKKEQERILSLLQQRFESERKRLLDQVRKVEGYSLLAVGSGSLNKQEVASRADLMKDGLEFWPVDEGEEWVDELGGHLYLGESQCAQ